MTLRQQDRRELQCVQRSARRASRRPDRSFAQGREAGPRRYGRPRRRRLPLSRRPDRAEQALAADGAQKNRKEAAALINCKRLAKRPLLLTSDRGCASTPGPCRKRAGPGRCDLAAGRVAGRGGAHCPAADAALPGLAKAHRKGGRAVPALAPFILPGIVTRMGGDGAPAPQSRLRRRRTGWKRWPRSPCCRRY